jgi:DNA-binding response OmpR family regulator
MRILVIDDEPDVLLLCRVNLEFAGHDVFDASDADRGMQAVFANEPDLIILDIMLPMKDGLAFLRELRSNPITADIPVILLTAKTQGSDQLVGFQTGADEYITKPFSPAVLTNTIESVFRMSPEERASFRDKAMAQLSAFRDTPP